MESSATESGVALLRAKNVELAAYKAYLESIIQSASDSMIVIGPDAAIKMVNRAALELLGYAEHELLRQPLEFFFADGTSFKGTEYARIMAAGVVRERDATFLSKDGASIPARFSASLARSKSGAPIGVVCIARDMREFLRMQSDLARAQAELLQAEKMSAVGQLAAGIAHEINNPLGIILGFAQALAGRVPGTDPISFPLKSIEREALRCRNLVRDLLSFSRRSKMSAESFDLNVAVTDILRVIETSARLKSVAIVRKMDSLEPVWGDKNQIQQMVVNLCSNAVDALPKGGTITVRTRPARADDGHGVVLEVEDDGVGIAENIQREVFNPFFTTKEVGKGTGLGLSLVHEIVSRHGGKISLKSTLGRGTTFTIHLPGRMM